MPIELVPTGIPGLDEVLGGGIPRRINVLVEGPPGSGKSILCWQFLYQGAKAFREPGVFVSVEERPEDVRTIMSSAFGWDIAALERENLISIIDASAPRVGVPSREKYVEAQPTDVETLLYTIHKLVDETGAKRLVIDSLSAMCLHVPEKEIGSLLFKLHVMLLELGCTTFLISQLPRGPYSFLAPAETIAQGVIELNIVQRGTSILRTFRVKKMRGLNHRLETFPFQIGKDGIRIFPGEMVYETLEERSS